MDGVSSVERKAAGACACASLHESFKCDGAAHKKGEMSVHVGASVLGCTYAASARTHTQTCMHTSVLGCIGDSLSKCQASVVRPRT